MAILKEEVLELVHKFHEASMIKKANAEEQAKFFLYPSSVIYVLHGEDLTLQANYEIHQTLTDEMSIPFDEWDIIPLSKNPEKARAMGAVYWQGHSVDAPKNELLKCIVGEDWIIQRDDTGELKIALYINSYHYFLPDSAKPSFSEKLG